MRKFTVSGGSRIRSGGRSNPKVGNVSDPYLYPFSSINSARVDGMYTARGILEDTVEINVI